MSDFKKHQAALAATCVAMLGAASSFAQSPSYRLGWFDTVNQGRSITNFTQQDAGPKWITRDFMRWSVAYNEPGDVALAQSYLDAAEDEGVRVILDVGRNNVNAGNLDAIEVYVRLFDAHPALEAWYLYDEPDEIGISTSEGLAAYNRVKSVSGKAIYGAMDADRNTFSNPPQIAYRSSYDHLMTFEYPLDVNDPPFSGMQGSFITRGWLASTARSAQRARSDGKAWTNIIQAYGRDGQFPALGTNLRLPTDDELRFMTFYSIINHDADGVYYWASQFTDGSDAIANQPYPDNGVTWRREVFRVMTAEFDQHYGKALAAGELAGAVDITSVPQGGSVVAEVYRDPDNQRAFLFLTNASEIVAQVQLRLQMDDIASIITIDGHVPTLAGDTLSLSMDRYGVGIYELIPAAIPEPGALSATACVCGLLWRRRRSAKIQPAS